MRGDSCLTIQGMALNVTELLAGAVKTALHAAALPAPEAVAWEIPREAQHGDYATNVAMTLARPARRPPRQVAEAIVRHLPAVAAMEGVEIAGPGFLNVFLAPQWCAEALREILLAGEGYGRSDLGMGRRYRIEFVSANPTGPLVIVNARAAAVGDALARVLRKSDGDLPCFAVDIGFHHFGKFADVDCVIDLLGPDHHGYIPRLKAAMTALGHPEAAFDVLIVQLVTLLRDGQPVRMSKRRGEFVLMEELLEEVGRDAARFTFLTRRHDSPLEFDLAVATRQSADNPVYYVQYAHARIAGIFETLQQRRLAVPDWSRVVVDRLSLPEELTLIKMLLQFPNVLADVVRTLEPHRLPHFL